MQEPRLATAVIQLLGDKEEKRVASQIHKVLKSSATLLLGEASSKGLSNILHCSVPGWSISGLLRFWVSLLPHLLVFYFGFVFARVILRDKNGFTSVQKLFPSLVRWCDWKGRPQSVAGPMPSLVSVSKRPVKPSVKDVLFRDPDNSVAGEIQRHAAEWSKILDSNPKHQEIVLCNA